MSKSVPAPLTILFADMARSTSLFERYGDVEARRIVAHALGMLGDITTEYGGTIIKTIGDEIMCTFPEPHNAVIASCEMQRAIGQDISLVEKNIAVKIGLHYGEVLQEEGDVFGDAVNVAARMVGLARAYQIITSPVTVADVNLPEDISARNLGEVRIRGKQEAMEIVEVIWQEDTSNMTMLPGVMPRPPKLSLTRLVLTRGDVNFEVTAGQPTARLGRVPQNDLIVDMGLVSRWHATVELRQGKFVLIDRSTNGTYLQTGQGERFMVHREEFALHGKGIISLGKEVQEGDPDLIYYTCHV
ncbi:MAG TPA: adenylate/guanylate cyclase domain-containing protein [Anaerolineae bacterium]|nr:adenylate/guanylate cyclase domain-containing protein [Anaerolineae bacterium]